MDPAPAEAAAPGGPVRRRRPVARRVLAGAAALLALIAGLLLAVRFGADTDPGRALIVRLAEGTRLGPVGRLHVEGLDGDVFGRFSLRRLSVVDARGTWLDARDLRLDWRPVELLGRRVHAERLTAGDLVILRRPVVEARPHRPPTEGPVSVRIDAAAGRLQTRPAFSDVAGDWTLAGALDYSRRGRASGRVVADSRLHAGDGVRLDFQFGADRLHLLGRAVEGRGGALAGALGLPSDRRFTVEARADGDDAGGRFHLDARSGDARPAGVEGVWTPRGGRLDARIRLSDSRLTHYFAERIGPEIHLVASGRRRPDGLYDVDAQATGAQAQARARGPVDARRRTTPGLDLALAVKDLSLWTKPVVLGATTARGRVVGGLDRFTYAGRLSGGGFLQNDYTVARIEGPGELTRADGEWRFSARLQGSGGGGKGGLVPLLGPSPTLEASTAVVRGDRFLIRELHLAGSRVKVDAQGGQDLFGGGFTFKGRFSAASLAGVRPGSRGAVEGDWSARTPRGAHVWRYDVRAQARTLATGLPELDRLLGPAPRLTAEGGYQDGAATVARADLTGAAAQAGARGVLGRGSTLAFDLDWRASGPFAVGPVAVSGLVKGGGRLTGTLSAPHADLQADLASLDLGRLVVRPAHLALTFAQGPGGLDGRASLTGTDGRAPAAAHADFRFVPRGLELTDVSADAGGVKLAGALSLRDGLPSTADLHLLAGPGAFLEAGRLEGTVRVAAAAGGAPSVALDLHGAGLVAPGIAGVLSRLSLTAAGPLDHLPLRLALETVAPVPASFAGEGLLVRTGEGAAAVDRLSLSGGGRVRRAAFRTLEPAVLRLGPDGRTLRLRLTAAGGRAELDARQAGAPGGAGLEASARVTDVALGEVVDGYVGAVSGGLTLNGRGSNLSGRLDAQVAKARGADATPDLALDGVLHASLADSRLKLEATASNGQGLRSNLVLDLPAEAAADPFRVAVDRTRPLRGSFQADGELQPLWDLFGGGERTLSGRLSAKGTLAGTLNDLRPTGGVSVADGRFLDASTGLSLRKFEAQAQFAQNEVRVARFSGLDSRTGALSGRGVVSLARDGASTFQLALDRFQLIDNDLGRATASGSVTVQRDAQGRARVAGRLAVDRADIVAKPPVPTGVTPMEVEEVNLPAPAGGGVAAPRARGSGLIALDVSLHAPRAVFVRGRGVNVEMSLDAHVGGTTLKPDLSGAARIVRGDYDFSGKRFDFDESGVIRLASKPEDIRLDLKAERNDPALDAVVRVRGTAARPEITLTSLPVLPQDEILSRVLFGVSASQLSGFEAAQLATAIAGLATGGGFDVLSNLRQFAGLDRLALGGDAAGATISGGKYLTRNLYVELTGASTGRSQTATTAAQQARTGPSAEVEWRVRRNLSLVSQVWTGGDAQLSVRFRRSR